MFGRWVQAVEVEKGRFELLLAKMEEVERVRYAEVEVPSAEEWAGGSHVSSGVLSPFECPLFDLMKHPPSSSVELPSAELASKDYLLWTT